MTLSRYLELHNLSPAEFARQHHWPASTISRLLAGERAPGLPLMQEIYIATGGQVTPNDFLSEEALARAAQPAERVAP